MSASGYKVYGQANVIASDLRRGNKFIDEKKFQELFPCAVLPGDILLTMMGTSGRCALVPQNATKGIMDSHLLRLRTNSTVDTAFAAFVLDQAPYVKEQVFVAGKGSIMHGLNSSLVKNLILAFPPLAEQNAIVRFLDHANRRIERYIRAKKKLIALLNEQKQAIIHRAVTRGLDPNVRLKPTSAEFLGSVPEHWRIAKLQRLTTRIGDGLHGTPQYVDNSPHHFINGNNLVNGSIVLTSSTRCVSPAEARKHKNPLDESSLLMSINGTIGNVAYYQGESIVLGKSAAYMNCGNALSRNYLFFFLQSAGVQNFFRREVTGTTIFNLSLESIRNLPVALPSLTGQLEISSFLDLRTAGLKGYDRSNKWGNRPDA
jgi:type I restriction enzyme S subunit